MYAHPIMSPREVEHALNITAATANKLLRALEQNGIVKETSGRGRNRLYVLHEYLAIFKR
jgi:ribosomal protein S25